MRCEHILGGEFECGVWQCVNLSDEITFLKGGPLFVQDDGQINQNCDSDGPSCAKLRKILQDYEPINDAGETPKRRRGG